MTNDEAILLRRNAYKRAMSLVHCPIAAEDMAHDVLLRYLEYEAKHGKRSRQTIEQAMIEDARANLGRSEATRARRSAIQEPVMGLKEFMTQETPVQPEQFLDIVEHHLAFLTAKERVCIELMLANKPNPYIWNILGITESMLCRIRRSAIRKIRDSIAVYGDFYD